ncbi:MAG: hypothetical protein HN488_09015, partial [Saprospiraceae bacterium]|nr:hypothetical protein [Saprospiraceae bacterium]
GSTNGEFIDSYVDLSAYKGESIKIRFRLGTDDNTTVDADWYEELTCNGYCGRICNYV